MAKVHTYDPRFSAMKKMQKDGKNASSMLQENRNLILQLIRKHGSVSRKQLSENSGLQQATVTIIIKELLEQGLIKENGMIDGGSGRKVKSFTLAEDLYVIVLRFNGVYLKTALFDVHLHVLYVQKVFFEESDYISEMMDIMEQHVAEIEKLVNKEKILCVMIGVEHMYKLIDNDYVVWDSFQEQYYPIGKKVYQRVGYKVFVNRAINFTTYDLWDRYKRHVGFQNDYAMLVYIQFSYDLEGAIIVNHELLYGMEGLCGKLGDLKTSRESGKTYNEAIAVPALLERAAGLLQEYPDSCIAEKEEINIRDIIAGYDRGDPLCRKVYDEAAEYLGYVFAQFLNWLDTDALLIGDEIPSSKDFEKKLRNETAKYIGEEKAKRIELFLFEIGERATRNDPMLIGGARYAFDLLISDIGIY